MKSVVVEFKKGPLHIHEKRWYFRLVKAKTGEYNRARALMDDYEINQLAHHLVICFIPDRIPGQTRPFRNKEGGYIRLYAFFESYLEFYQYMQHFEPRDRAFFEIVFGELPQKPHFDIDVSQGKLDKHYPGENIDSVSELLREAVMIGCIQVLADLHVTVEITRDMLVYSSHGTDKRSWHILLTNKCHDGNDEAKAFYFAVMAKVKIYTGGKYIRENFIDVGVYSPRQQFRTIGSQKVGSNRPKIFCEEFMLSGIRYKHVYTEDVSDPRLKKLVVIYESLIGFTTGCVYLPSLVPEKPAGQYNLGDMPDLESRAVEQCMQMLRDKVKECPFTVRQVQGHLIMLVRKAPSHCPICNVIHHAENPYIVIVGSKVYWDCRRASDKVSKLLLGYLTMTVEELMAGHGYNEIIIDEDIDSIDNMMFGDYMLNHPTGQPVTEPINNPVPLVPATTPPQPISLPPQPISLPKINVPVEQRMQNVAGVMNDNVRKAAMKKYIRSQAEDLTGVRSLSTVLSEMSWNPGLK